MPASPARAIAVVGLLVTTTLVSCGRTTTLRTSADECDPVRSLETGTSEHTVESQGRGRSYLLHLPPDYDGASRVPVMFLFHGLGGDPATLLDTTKLDDVADERGFAIVAPQGGGLIPSWRFREQNGGPATDITFTHDLLDEVEDSVCLDRDRVYAAGFSNGSALTLALACERSSDFAAFAAVSAPYFGPECSGAPPRPIVYFHGLRDVVVPFTGAKTVIGPLPPVPGMLESWAAHDRCNRPAATDRPTSHVLRYRWRDCAPGSDLEAYIVAGGGHRWPGGVDVPTPGSTGRGGNPVQGIMTQEIDASELIWDFVRLHRQ